MRTVEGAERRRRILQVALDAEKGAAMRNHMGQFATPPALAVDILRYARAQFGKRERVRFIDPAIGTGVFYSALLDAFPKARVRAAMGYEIDPRYGIHALDLWAGRGLDVRVEDFTRAIPPVATELFNLLICNPPYVRHHHVLTVEKRRLRRLALDACGIEISGLAGLHCYFLGLGHAWMARGGLAGWLLPSEFMDVNYGVSVKRYLLDAVTLLHIHRFDPNDVQFSDARVSSAVVWFRNAPPPIGHEVRFTHGGSLARPNHERLVPADTLRCDSKWTHYPMTAPRGAVDGPVLGDYFTIKRGLATGNNAYFILSPHEIELHKLPLEAFKPILPSPRYLRGTEVLGDRNGNPVLDRRLFLLDPPWEEAEIRERHPALWAYLERGKANGVAERYLCRHRSPWYSQERRPPAPFVCTYLGRDDTAGGRTFRFILNTSKATAANAYLMLYPNVEIQRALLGTPALTRRIWACLNQLSPQAMRGEGRVYGGGLHKLEPRELGNVPARALSDVLLEHRAAA